VQKFDIFLSLEIKSKERNNGLKWFSDFTRALSASLSVTSAVKVFVTLFGGKVPSAASSLGFHTFVVFFGRASSSSHYIIIKEKMGLVNKLNYNNTIQI
jgi:hypothetical protein